MSSRGMQKVQIIGNLGHDPELRFVGDNIPVTSFSVAVNREWNNKDGSKGQEVTWFRVTAWRGLAEVCTQYLSKGRKVYVEGRMKPAEDGRPRIWEGNDGMPRTSYELSATQVLFLGGGNGQGAGQQGTATAGYQEPAEEEIPF